MCRYVLCDKEIKKGEQYIHDLEGHNWCLLCYDLMLYRDLASYKGYEIEKRIKELENNKIIKIMGKGVNS